MMLGTYGAEAKPENRQRVADERARRIEAKRADLAARLAALKGGN